MAATHPTRPSRTTRAAGQRTAKQAWAGGLTAFAGVMLLLAGLLGVFRGIMAIAHDNVFVATPNYVFKFDLTSWGWIHLVLGALACVVSFGLVRPAPWARVAGVGIAGLVIIANFLSLPYSPLWSIVIITMSGFIIWALCVVQGEETTMSP
ncbi:hypothetical protein [Streptomyces sp. NPDC101165]|uniref:DUF7144 family membrane protein n=1 Tax=Streptomyces sp. NPDC101165 TaxID=3366119 RepID=UPI00380A53EC